MAAFLIRHWPQLALAYAAVLLATLYLGLRREHSR
jgi:hypothetical protein